MGVLAAGSYFSYESGGVYTALAEVMDISGPNGTVGDVDITHLLSSNVAKDYIPGFHDGGTVSFTMRFNAANLATMYGFIRSSKYWRITCSNGSKWDFYGHINGYGTEVPLEEDITQTFQFKLSGKPTFTA